ncbi:MAG: HD family hydrolase [Cohaesibacteraceae bacterium]|nr:HD family hydrolase [Cohaesibacteraceae bacterium]
MSNKPKRAWQRMISGRRLDLLDPSPLDVEIEDIAHGLARVARWNGQTAGDHAFSVAQHSIIVEEILVQTKPDISARWRLAALMHDAPEYVIGDMISPFKTVMGGDYTSIEKRLQDAIHIRCNLPREIPPGIYKIIKRADVVSAYYEATLLAGFEPLEAMRLFGQPRNINPDLLDFSPWPSTLAQSRFLDRFKSLSEINDMEANAP